MVTPAIRTTPKTQTNATNITAHLCPCWLVFGFLSFERTQVGSRRVVQWGAGLMMLFGIFSKFGEWNTRLKSLIYFQMLVIAVRIYIWRENILDPDHGCLGQSPLLDGQGWISQTRLKYDTKNVSRISFSHHPQSDCWWDLLRHVWNDHCSE